MQTMKIDQARGNWKRPDTLAHGAEFLGRQYQGTRNLILWSLSSGGGGLGSGAILGDVSALTGDVN